MKNTHRYHTMYGKGWIECSKEVADMYTGNPSIKVEKLPEIDLCETCNSRESQQNHTCPYAEEIAGSDKECNCCDYCTTQCAMDI